MPAVAVKGMHCDHCRRSVEQAVAALPGVASAKVDLQKAEAAWENADAATPVSPETVKAAIQAVGFDAE